MNNSNKLDTKIFVVTHKKLNKKYYPDREIIYVGPKQDEFFEKGDYKDSLGDNISSKNYTYCECTAIYYIWKNVNCDIVGIEHYRRVFSHLIGIKKKKFFEKKLRKNDFIVMYEFPFLKTMKKQFLHTHDEKFLIALENAIKKVEPDYLDAFHKMLNGHHLAWCNMFVTKKEQYDDYCKFLFNVLFEVEKNIEIPTDSYQKRIMGFLSERLLSTYLIKNNNLKVKHTLVLITNRYKKK